MKFSALNVDFDDLSLDFLDTKPAHEGIKERYFRKSRYFTAVGQSFVKGMDMLLNTTSTSDELFSRINIDDFEKLCELRK